MYASHAKSLASFNEPVRRRKAINEFTTKLASKLPNKDEFIEKFKSLKYSDKFNSQKREVQYVVVKLFEWMFPAFSINATDMSIEHIEPQSGVSLPDTTMASIGNLWFLRTSFNNQLGNEPAILKLAKYKENQLPCDSTLSRATEWGNHEVEQRTNELAERFWLEISKQFGIQTAATGNQKFDLIPA
ncbi:hypothetical protein B2J86_13970 [Acidovorax sp. SRB_14]|nr:hypothetical protein [Acidovorax sp. SRB_14]